MPVTYALSTGASILFGILQLRQVVGLSFYVALPAWALLSSFRLDWSGTSTAGAIAVLAAFSSLLLVVLNSKQSLSRRLTLYALFGFMLLLTKAPSVLSLPLVILSTEAVLLTRHRKKVHRTITLAGISAFAGATTLFILPIFSSIVGGFSVEWGEQRGDDLSRNGLLATLVTLTGRSGWIIGLAVVAWLVSRLHSNLPPSDSQFFVRSTLLALAIAIGMDALVVGIANTNEYFSGPFYFLSLLTLLTFGPSSVSNLESAPNSSMWRLWTGVATATVLLAAAIDRVTLPSLINSSILKDLLTDSRVLFSSALVGVLIVRPTRLGRSTTVVSVLLLSLITFVGLSPIASRLSEEGWQPVLSDLERNVLTGPPDAITAATWLRDNSEPRDIVATNYLRDKSGEFENDFSLAAWSQREFLVIGPSLAFDSALTDSAIDISEEFALRPSALLAAELRSRGVKWYIVDLDKTPLRSWEPYAEIAVMTWRFWVLRLR